MKTSVNQRQINNSRLYSIDAFRLVAAFFVVVIHFSFLGEVGNAVWINSYFAVPWFFIVAGLFLDLESDQALDKIKKRIKHIGIIFIVTAIVYFLINCIYFGVIEGKGLHWLVDSLTVKNIIKFLALNVWPFEIGGAIWFLQAMLYTYILFFILLKLKINFLKYELLIIVIFLLLNAVVGEFSTIFKIHVIMANFFTRGIPYILLGHYINRKSESLKTVSNVVCILLMILSVILTTTEYYGLKSLGVLFYTGHYQGNTLMAIALVILLLNNPNWFRERKAVEWGMKYSLMIYLVHQPLGQIIKPQLEKSIVLRQIAPIMIFIFSFIISIVLVNVFRIIKEKTNSRKVMKEHIRNN